MLQAVPEEAALAVTFGVEDGVEVELGRPETKAEIAAGIAIWIIETAIGMNAAESVSVIETGTESETGGIRETLGLAVHRLAEAEHRLETSAIETEMGPCLMLIDLAVDPGMGALLRPAHQILTPRLECRPLDVAVALCAVDEAEGEVTGRRIGDGGGRPTMIVATGIPEVDLKRLDGAESETTATAAIDTRQREISSDETPEMTGTATTGISYAPRKKAVRQYPRSHLPKFEMFPHPRSHPQPRHSDPFLVALVVVVVTVHQGQRPRQVLLGKSPLPPHAL
jgi:hypothetical protein